MAVPEFCKKVATTLKDLRIKNNLSIEELAKNPEYRFTRLKAWKILNMTLNLRQFFG
jgi:hypothetical protein